MSAQRLGLDVLLARHPEADLIRCIHTGITLPDGLAFSPGRWTTVTLGKRHPDSSTGSGVRFYPQELKHFVILNRTGDVYEADDHGMPGHDPVIRSSRARA